MRTRITLLMLTVPTILLIGLLIAACVPTPSDPYTLQAAGEHALNTAYQQMTATAESAIRANEAAILVQAQTQASNDNAATATAQVLYSNATATALYYEAQATQQAATAQVIATQEAQLATATAQAVKLAQIQANATATQAAQVRMADAEAARLSREKVITVLGWLAVFILAGVAIFLMVRLAEMFIDTARRQRSWIPGAESFTWETEKGLSLIQPRKMFSPAIQLEQKTGVVTMPQLSSLNEQLYTTLAALAVELQREISKRAQWFTPMGKHGESFAPMPIQETPTPLLPTASLQPLPMFTDRHVLIAGATGRGKTHTARYLLQARQTAYVLDPHDDGATWPEHCTVIGGGRDFTSIAQTIERMIELMNNRYQQRGMGASQFNPVTLAVDEIPALVAHQPEISKKLMQIGMEGRKAGLFLVLMSHSVFVRSLGIEGQGDLRENFATVKLDPLPPGVSEDTPRQCTVIIGNLHKPESEEKYIVPALGNSVPVLTGRVPGGVLEVPALGNVVPERTENGVGTRSHTPGTGFPGGNVPPSESCVPGAGTREETELIHALAGQGYSVDKIAHLLGGRRQNTLARVKAVLGQI